MHGEFHQILSKLRKNKRVSQRQVAADLYISQALLSHYENGIREPGLDFVNRVCSYYGVTADYLLGRTAESEVCVDSRTLIALLQTVRQAEASLVSLDSQISEYIPVQGEE